MNGAQRALIVWQTIRRLCLATSHASYPYYGGKGVKLRWASSEAFLNDMGPCPAGKTIRRKNPNGDFSPQNCFWGDPPAKGRRIAVTIAGRKFSSLYQAARYAGLPYKTVIKRVSEKGWSVERALTTPVMDARQAAKQPRPRAKGRKQVNAIPIKIGGVRYESLQEASEATGIPYSTLRARHRGNSKR